MKEKQLMRINKLKAPANNQPKPDAPTEAMHDDTLDFLERMGGTASDGDSDIETETESDVQTLLSSNQDDTLEFLDWMGDGRSAPSSGSQSRYSDDKIREMMLRALRNSKSNG